MLACLADTYIYRILFIMCVFCIMTILFVSICRSWWYGGVVKGMLQYVGCLGEGHGPSWANVEGWQSSTFPQAPTRVACSLGKW